MNSAPQQIWSMDRIIDSVRDDLKKGSKVLISGCGKSMEPLINAETDKILLEGIKEGEPVKKGEIYLYRRSTGAYAVHRVYKVRKNELYMLGDSQLLVEKGILREWLLGRVVRIVKPDGEVELTSDESLKASVKNNSRRIRDHKLKCFKHFVYSVTVGRFKKKN